MKRLLFVFIIIASFGYCVDKNRSLNVNQNTFVDYYSTGKKKSEGFVVNYTRVGCWNYYYGDESIQATGCYNDGLKEGAWVYYDSITKKVNDSIKWSIYLNDQRGFKFNYPLSWTVKEAYERSNAVVVSNYSKRKPFYDNFNITTQDFNNDFVLIDEFKKTVNKYKDLEILSSEEIEINNNQAVFLSFLINDHDVRLKVFQIAIKNRNTFYLISCFSEELDFTTYERLYREIAFSFTTLTK